METFFTGSQNKIKNTTGFYSENKNTDKTRAVKI